MSYLAAFLPVAIYIFVVYRLDHFALLSVKRLLLLVLCGMAAALACFGLFQLTGRVLSEGVSDVVNPVLEEAVKGIPLLVLARRKRIAFFIDSVICGAAVGGGFSLLENLFYLLLGEQMGFGTVLFRGLEVALIHMGCSAIVAAGLMFAVRIAERVRSRLQVKWQDLLMAALLLVAAPVLHVCHNAFHFNPLIQFFAVFGVMAGLLVWTYQYDGDMIHRWLDKGLDKQMALLRSIQEGKLDETKTGAFLLSIKDSFPPEVFFDVICFVQLNVTLSVAAKSRFMLREAGLDMPLEADQAATLLAQYEEYELLGKHLGQSARMAVAPVVKFYPADRKALDDLRAECQAVLKERA